MKLQLADSVATPQDLKQLISEVKQYAKWFAHLAIKKRVDPKATAEPPVMSAAANHLLREQNSQKPLTQEDLDKLITALEDFASSAPEVNITLAGPAAGDLKKTLVAWCRQNIAPNALINFAFNSTLLGGLVIRYGSHVFDWSFRRQILAGRGSFPEVLRRV